MKRNIAMILVVISICIGIKSSAYGEKLYLEDQLKKITENKIKFNTVQIEGRATGIIDKFPETVARSIYAKSQLKCSFKLQKHKKGAKLILIGSGINGMISVVEDNSGRAYLSFSLSQSYDKKNINNVRGCISKGFSSLRLTPSFSVLITGISKGQLPDKSLRNIIREFQFTNSYLVKGENTTSICGYSPFVKEATAATELVNVNMGIHYNNLSKESEVYIGSPLIFIEY